VQSGNWWLLEIQPAKLPDNLTYTPPNSFEDGYYIPFPKMGYGLVPWRVHIFGYFHP